MEKKGKMHPRMHRKQSIYFQFPLSMRPGRDGIQALLQLQFFFF